jgi:hypothetical protein
MISLACTDLLVGFVTPFNTIRIGRWTLGHHYCEFITSMVVILLSASIYNFVCVNLDRLIAVKMPLRYQEMKDKRWLVKGAIFACWILSLVPAIPMWTSFDTRTAENDGTGLKCSFPYKSVSKGTKIEGYNFSQLNNIGNFGPIQIQYNTLTQNSNSNTNINNRYLYKKLGILNPQLSK